MAFDVKKHLMKVTGKDYLPVAWRLVWFREERPLGRIITAPLELNTQEGIAIFQATVMDENGNILAMGTKCETRKGFGDFIEKAETGAIGRALAGAGYGTQFEPELDEGDRLADSPQVVQRPTCEDCGAEIQPLETSHGTLTPAQVAENSKKKFGKVLCAEHRKALNGNGNGGAQTEQPKPNGNKGKPAKDPVMARLCILCEEVFGKDEGGIAVMRQWFGAKFGVEHRTELSEGQKADAIMQLDEMAKAKA
jgi:hypothetical protein